MSIARAPVVLILCAAGLWAGESASPVGTWRGESKCQTDAPACHDEQVVYTISVIPDRVDAYLVRADKVVDGQVITMGQGPWAWDAKQQTLTFGPSERVWRMTEHGDRMDAVLTLADGSVFRRMSLTRDPR